ncbi:hypothetical protein FE257_001323 [Aspergillus nanangensis]|uniref:Zn(2)-C6 fungal-type domain-containing protein n=1 Tax=Aspergillus nanangensis TaxID=2582783 RepID=A0AAD4CDW9_ASPNN|nr:hypothetical protein FE257_001323 [Aspergillus nanangensis]
MGRPLWRSSKCTTCRARKVKCDEARPVCRSCRRAGVKCEWRYGDSFVYLPTTAKHTSGSMVVRDSVSGQLPDLLDYCTLAGSDQYRLGIHPSMGRLYEVQILSSFLSEYIPQEAVRGAIVAGHQTFSWFESLPDQQGKRRLMDISLATLSLFFLGTKYGDPNALYCSQIYYNYLMREIQGLQHSNEDLIGIAAILSIHGIYNSSHQDNSWMIHVRSACKLLEERGPYNPVDKRLFCLIRTSAVYDACGQRKSTFMSRPEWRALAPKDEPFEQILNIYTFLPSLQELRDRICDAADHPEVLVPLREEFLCIFTQAYTQFRQGYRYLLGCREELPFRTRTAVPNDLLLLQERPDLADVFPEVIEFTDQYTFQIILLCWTGFFIMYWEASEVMRILDTDFGDAQFSRSPPHTTPGCHARIDEDECRLTCWPSQPDQQIETTVREVEALATIFATRICQAMSFCDKYPFGSALKLPSLSPLWIVQQFFHGRSDRRWLWCKTVLHSFPSRSVGFGYILSNMSFQEYKTI